MYTCLGRVELSGFYRYASMEVGGQSKQKVECKRLRLAEAIADGRLYQAKIILEKTSNVNYLDMEGISPLMRALMIEDEKHRTRNAMVRLLLQHKADVNLRDERGKHALSWACRMNKLDLVKVLFEKCLQDIDLASQDIEGNTALMFAVQNNNVDMVRLLVDAMRKFSLSVDQRNREDKTPYYKAVEMSFEECASILSDVGKASQSIKVNPFLDFLGLGIDNVDCREKVRVSSAPAGKECAKRGTAVGRRHVVARRKNATKFGDGNRKISSKKRGNRLLKSRKVHSEVSQKKTNQNGNTWRGTPKSVQETKVEGRNIEQGRKNANRCRVEADKVTIVVGDDSTPKKSEYVIRNGRGLGENCLKNSPQKRNSVADKQDRFLQLILDESGTETTSGRRSKSPVSCVSTNHGSRSISPANSIQERQKCIVPSVNNFLESQDVEKDLNAGVGVVCRTEGYHTRKSESKSTIPDQNYYAYLEWKASLDYPPNTLRSLLSLRAEQQSEVSSYRKGHVLPKYEPGTDESGEDRSVDVVSPVSERSGKSEAMRKISAVAKTVGLSVYLSNKRRSWNRKDT